MTKPDPDQQSSPEELLATMKTVAFVAFAVLSLLNHDLPCVAKPIISKPTNREVVKIKRLELEALTLSGVAGIGIEFSCLGSFNSPS